MGQKVNPVGFRLGVNRGWDSVWYATSRDFRKLPKACETANYHKLCTIPTLSTPKFNLY